MKTILVVEDDKRVGESLVEGLREAGYDVTRVRRGRDAIAADAGRGYGFAIKCGGCSG